MTTNVVFKVEETEGPDGKSWGDQVIAVLPQSAKRCNPGCVMTYAHVGQHSEASIPYIVSLRNATPEEYAPLLKELEEIGYDPRVVGGLGEILENRPV